MPINKTQAVMQLLFNLLLFAISVTGIYCYYAGYDVVFGICAVIMVIFVIYDVFILGAKPGTMYMTFWCGLGAGIWGIITTNQPIWFIFPCIGIVNLFIETLIMFFAVIMCIITTISFFSKD